MSLRRPKKRNESEGEREEGLGAIYFRLVGKSCFVCTQGGQSELQTSHSYYSSATRREKQLLQKVNNIYIQKKKAADSCSPVKLMQTSQAFGSLPPHTHAQTDAHVHTHTHMHTYTHTHTHTHKH